MYTFLEIAWSSLIETDSHVDLAVDLKYLSIEDYKVWLEQINKTAYLLMKFEQSQTTNSNRF